MMEKLLVLGAPIFQIEIIRKAKELGYVVCQGESTQEALRACQEAIEKIDFELA